MSKKLVIVESPAKAKTIEKYLGKDFQVLSSIGHIRSIVKKTKDGTPPIDIENGFKTTYEIDPEKKKVVAELRKAAKAADEVYLATDPDREGEAIAWHLCEVLKLNPKTTKRITYQEISKKAVSDAVAKPRTVDMDLVQAQQARQILDRIVGFELSPVVWQKVPGGKSAGRVQSPAVRLLVEREREITAFEGAATFKVTAVFTHQGEEIKAELPHKFATEQAAHDFLAHLADATFTITDVKKTPGKRNPSLPFTTSTLQQDANAKLGFGSKATMAAAQKLYQAGKITYMRTDSVNLSDQALASAASYIKSTYGERYVNVRKFKTKNANAQEAHEAIRPTDMGCENASSNEYDQKLYRLIRNRTLASQMAAAEVEKTVITIEVSSIDGVLKKITAEYKGNENASKDTPPTKKSLVFEAKGEIVTFDGFLKVYGGKKDDTILPAVDAGQVLSFQEALARQTFARPPARYTEGSLVKKLEEMGIGRPSTYATIIDTVQTRGYVEKGDSEGQPRDVVVLNITGDTKPASVDLTPLEHGRIARETEAALGVDNAEVTPAPSNDTVTREVIQEKTGSNKGKLMPTPSGELIADFLTEHFTQVVDYGFTANVEEDFDKIATAQLARNAMLMQFYKPFHELIMESSDIDRSKVGANRELGLDPKTKRPIVARFGRYGPMLQLGDTEDKENKPQFAPLPSGAKIETVTLEQALEMFKLPRVVGQTKDGQDIKANIGRFGPYIQVGKLFVSIKPEDPHTITLEKSLELYAEKLKTEAEKNIADFGDGIKVLNGRYGPYITDGKKNAKIPKDTEPKDITHEQAKAILAEAPEKKKRTRTTKKK